MLQQLMLVLMSGASSNGLFVTLKQLHSLKEGAHKGHPLLCPARPPPLSTSSWVPASSPGSRREKGCLATTFLVQPREATSHPQNSPQLHETGCQQRCMTCVNQA